MQLHFGPCLAVVNISYEAIVGLMSMAVLNKEGKTITMQAGSTAGDDASPGVSIRMHECYKTAKCVLNYVCM